MTSNQFRWWQGFLEECRMDGGGDADAGIFEVPYPRTDDEQEKQANEAYSKGWNQRRKELGDAFRWRQ